MTATSQTRRRSLGWASMESLGFFDSPTVSSNTTSELSAGPTVPRQTTTLVETGRHVARTGDVIEDMWNTTQLHAPSLLDWEPESTMSRKLGSRSFRWPVVAIVLVALIGVAAAGYWLYRLPESSAASARSQVSTQAGDLVQAVDGVQPLVAGLAYDSLPEANQDSSVFFTVDETARELFNASSALPRSATETRNEASEAASQALDATQKLSDATTFRTVLEPMLNSPELEVDPTLTDLTVVTAAFSAWRSDFDNVLEALPGDIAPDSIQAAQTLSARFDSIQSAYADAIRLGDGSTASGVVRDLTSDLDAIRQTMLGEMGSIVTEVNQLFALTRESLADLVG
jgi:hypothetical protein